MSWLAADYKGRECIYKTKPERNFQAGCYSSKNDKVSLPEGTIKKLTGEHFEYGDEPVEII